MLRAIVSLLVFVSCGVAFAGNITMKGSDTLVRLGQRWAEEFMKNNRGVSIQVSGGGSGTGIAALINGTTDICQASRDMKKSEHEEAARKNVNTYRVAVALDGIAVFINNENPLTELSLEQLKKIFNGTITNWKEIGGPDKKIMLYGRENNSGTYAYFKEHVLQNEDYAEQTQTLPGTAAVVNAVSKDKYGIGYGGIAWEKGVKHVAIKKDAESPAVMPTIETITNGSYPISRELYWFFNGKPSGELKAFVNWALSPEGQAIAEKIDYIPLPKEVALKSMVD